MAQFFLYFLEWANLLSGRASYIYIEKTGLISRKNESSFNLQLEKEKKSLIIAAAFLTWMKNVNNF